MEVEPANGKIKEPGFVHHDRPAHAFGLPVREGVKNEIEK
jgi:hypothetical protein